ncbi:hypothetical protein SKAU_G00245800 [Synaphobranchus kaupii]|uniref:Uncharacterized protein n=1 Tax=Synaphobranchus kaupii TaxID=118154 RepID=A0A9Q1F260_SYNKA|nr:hypothetical protein SKAU_G00245800 [Synaphobranchus kaupii]
MEDGDASDEVVGNSDTLLADGIRDQIPVASSVRGEECEQSVVAENSQEGGKAGTSGVEGNSWTEVDGRRRRKRRGQGESGVSQTQGKRHAGVQRGLFGGQQVGSTPTVESEGEWEEKEMGLGDSGEADFSASQRGLQLLQRDLGKGVVRRTPICRQRVRAGWVRTLEEQC